MYLSVVIPALNEKATIALVVEKAFKGMKEAGIEGEVIVADNGSHDDTVSLAKNAGALIVPVARKGYGSAVQGGCAAAKGDWILYADADNTYDFEQMKPYIDKLHEGYDFVIGNRYKGLPIKGNMPFLHRYLGTPVLTMIANVFFNLRIGDINCGMRALRKEAFQRMGCKCEGMEFASEMVARASLLKLKIAEVSCTLYLPAIGRKAHLNTWRDGWRHLCLLTHIFLNKNLYSATMV